MTFWFWISVYLTDSMSLDDYTKYTNKESALGPFHTSSKANWHYCGIKYRKPWSWYGENCTPYQHWEASKQKAQISVEKSDFASAIVFLRCFDSHFSRHLQSTCLNGVERTMRKQLLQGLHILVTSRRRAGLLIHGVPSFEERAGDLRIRRWRQRRTVKGQNVSSHFIVMFHPSL